MLKKNLFLIGYMGAGKSTIAQKLSGLLSAPLVEMDETIVRQQGMTINEIFEKYGEQSFRDMESRLIMDLGKGERSVISCGGGAVLRPENVENMKRSGMVIYLTAKPETILERVRFSTDRPLLNGHMNVEYISEMMDRRIPLYEAACDHRIATDGRSTDEICRDIMNLL